MAAALRDAWQPLANRLSAWIIQHQTAQAGVPDVKRLDTANKALQDAEKAARRDRFAPIVDHAKEIWAALRSESNVDINDIELAGAGNQRKVAIRAAVDGSDAGALSVMSQGELHALAFGAVPPASGHG